MPAIHGLTPVDHSRLPMAAGVMKPMAMISSQTMASRLKRLPFRAACGATIWLAAACLSPLAAQQALPAQGGQPGSASGQLPAGHPVVSPSRMGQNPVTLPPAAAPGPIQPSSPQPSFVPNDQGGIEARPPVSQTATGVATPAAGPATAPTAETALPELPSLQGPSVGGLPHDLSPWGMFMQADLVVKAVMVGLAFASLITWTVWLAKSIELAAAKRRARRSLTGLVEARSLEDAESNLMLGRLDKGVVAALVRAAKQEEDVSADLPADGIKERASAALSRIEARAGRLMTRGTGLLATIGATAPFVGLFGTVWGIMNSFIGIAKSNTTNLAVVAPGIAEALLATAIGLVAAIPAVIIYNVFARGITGYRAMLADAGTEVLRHLSRDLDRRAAANGRRKPSLFAAAE
ncbi:tonB-system energizer ExbB [Chelatococcus sp.]|uniref:tonB-system energizer ExbB n=1 Tax=Chelatococcus sp. TaxID=1953771 RepID=UPI0025BF5A8A|nr:tonB-system energizer ExbB [Chelatococcus sp.]